MPSTDPRRIGEDRKKPLYAVAAEVFVRGQWVADIVHCHADDAGEARLIYCAQEQRTKRIVAIGTVVGYHVEDEHGEVLRA